MSTPIQRYLSTAEFAKATGYSVWMICKFCRRGEIRAVQRKNHRGHTKGMKWMIPLAELDRFVRDVA